MTCVVGLRFDNCVYIGADSFLSDSMTGLKLRYPKKVFQVNDFIIGVCGSVRLLQTVAHKFQVAPKFVGQDIYDYVYSTFFDCLINCLRQEKCLMEADGIEVLPNSQMIIGIEDKIFVVQPDLSIFEPEEDFVCIGSGEFHSQGVMEILKGTDLTPAEKIQTAIEKTSKHVVSVNEDIIILTNNNKEEEEPELIEDTIESTKTINDRGE